jgi:hypothetical protein
MDFIVVRGISLSRNARKASIMCSRTSDSPDWFAALAQLPGTLRIDRLFQPLAKIAFILIAVGLSMEG